MGLSFVTVAPKSLCLATLLKAGITQSCGCSRLIDLTGQRLEKLTVKERGPNNRFGAARVGFANVDCGNTTVVDGNSLRGLSRSW